MLKTRFYTAGIGLLAATTFAMAGCTDKADTDGGDTPTPPPSTTVQGDARQAFITAAEKLNEQTVKVEMTMEGLAPMSGSGAMDPKAGQSTFAMDISAGGVSMKTSMVVIGQDLWTKISGVPGMPDKWMHVSGDKIKPGTNLSRVLQGDPAGAQTLGKGLVDIQWDGDNKVKGTVDLTNSSTLSETAVKQLGDKATAVPFTATIDAEGRLSSLTLDMNAVMPGAGKLTSTYSGFGEPVEVTKPADSDVIEMPEQILAGMNM